MRFDLINKAGYGQQTNMSSGKELQLWQGGEGGAFILRAARREDIDGKDGKH